MRSALSRERVGGELTCGTMASSSSVDDYNSRQQVAGAEFLELSSSMHDLVGRAAAQRHDNHILVPLFSNAAFMPFLKNLLCSMRRLQVRNWLAIALDGEICPCLRRTAFLEGHPHACVEPYLEQPLVTGDRAAYGSRAFWRLVVQRPLWIRWLLTQGYSVLQCDVDIVWLRNPLPYLTSQTEKAPARRCGTPLSVAGMESAVLASEHHAMVKHRALRSILTCPHHNTSLLIQSEASTYGYNVGFYLINPSNVSLWFMDEWRQEMLKPTQSKKMHEQHALLYTLGNLGSKTNRRWLARGMSMVRLNDALFPTGKHWFDYWQTSGASKQRSFILHNNWITQASQKKLRLRRENLWFLDEQDERCQANLDPLEEHCHRRCVPVGNCTVGSDCLYWGCRAFTQRALTDLARSLRSGTNAEDRWHSMAWKQACPSASPSGAPSSKMGGGGGKPPAGEPFNAAMLTVDENAALDRAALLLAAGAPASEIFALRYLTDIKSNRRFGDGNISHVTRRRSHKKQQPRVTDLEEIKKQLEMGGAQASDIKKALAWARHGAAKLPGTHARKRLSDHVALERMLAMGGAHKNDTEKVLAWIRHMKAQSPEFSFPLGAVQ